MTKIFDGKVKQFDFRTYLKHNLIRSKNVYFSYLFAYLCFDISVFLYNIDNTLCNLLYYPAMLVTFTKFNKYGKTLFNQQNTPIKYNNSGILIFLFINFALPLKFEEIKSKKYHE